ncbi:hypothetical protein [uncultured Pseudokineococcus sp.]|uniref:hypothetical protein n=1 Tax=uncultured Pseudokineococcus sp. TaxID=1642928 RepID=UPI002616676F|nr:hypothetical protein [uncultured Pseudokineococcus sp.]
MSYLTNLMWGLPSALATVALINILRRLMPDDRLLPFLLAPTIVIVIVLLLRRLLPRRVTGNR